MNNQNLKFLEDTFLNTQHLCTWHLNKELQLVSSNCPEQDFFYNIFSIGGCTTVLQNHFEDSNLPILIKDDIGFVWACINNGFPDDECTLCLLGPMFTSEMTSSYLIHRFGKLHLSQNLLDRIIHYLKDTPTVNPSSASSFAAMMHYCINHEPVITNDVMIITVNSNEADDEAWGGASWHGTWLEEQKMFNDIKEGRLVERENRSAGVIGKMSNQDPLRQAKNEIIVFLVLCSRAAILGGVSSEGSLNLSDYYIQAIEKCESTTQVYKIGQQIQNTYIARVQEVRKNRSFSLVVQETLEYIETHLHEKILLKDISKAVGYTEYYISRCFNAEIKESLTNYIIRKKIQLSKTYLVHSTASIAEISDYLGFSSPSYFISSFKKYIKMSPAEFGKNCP